MDTWIGEKTQTKKGIDLYIIEKIGQGSSSYVYKAKASDHTLYAIKIFKNLDSDISELLQNEIHTLARIHHSYINKVYESGVINNHYYIIMEYFDGDTLTGYFEKQCAFSSLEMFDFTKKLASVLSEVHRRKIIHCDLKPENILINKQKEIRIIDFGLSGFVESHDKQDRVVGSLLFSSPEQSRMFKRPIDHRSDIYAFGLLIYFCLTKTYPYQAEDVPSLLNLHAHGDLPLLPKDVEKSPFWNAIIHKMIEKDPDDRYQSCQGVLQDMHKFYNSSHSFEYIKSYLDSNYYAAEMNFQTPLFGMDKEIETLKSNFLKNDNGLYLVEGAPGSGKSRFIMEFCKFCIQNHGAILLKAKCQMGVHASFFAIKKLFQSFLDQVSLDDKENFITKVINDPYLKSQNLSTFNVCFPVVKNNNIEENSPEMISYLMMLLFREIKVIVFIDDIQWADSATIQAISKMFSDMNRASFFMIVASRDDEKSQESLMKFKSFMEEDIHSEFFIKGLDSQYIRGIAFDYLGHKKIDQNFLEWVVARANGSPFSLKEHLKIILEKKVLNYSWESWTLDEEVLASIHLPDDIVDLVLERAMFLNDEAIRILSIAALDEGQFDLRLIEKIAVINQSLIEKHLNEAINKGLIEYSGRGEYTFTHDRIYEAFLQNLSQKEKKYIHSKIRKVLSTIYPENHFIHRKAYHYRSSHITRSSYDDAFLSNLLSGERALKESAYQEAENALEFCLSISDSIPEKYYYRFYKSIGIAKFRRHKHQDAIEYYDQALEDKKLPKIEIAELLDMKTWVHLSRYQSALGIESAMQALENLGCTFVRSPFKRCIYTLTMFIKYLLPFQVNKKKKNARLDRLMIRLNLALSHAAYYHLKPILLVQGQLWSFFYIKNHGSLNEKSISYSGLSVITSTVRMKKTSQKLADYALDLARESDNPAVNSEVHYYAGVAADIGGNPKLGLKISRDNIVDMRRWLDPVHSHDGLNMRIHIHCMQGYLLEAEKEIQQFFMNNAEMEKGMAYSYFHIRRSMVLSLMGHFKEASLMYDKHNHLHNILEGSPFLRSQILSDRLLIAFASDDLNENIDEIEKEWNHYINIHPTLCLFYSKYYYISRAHARLEMCLNIFLNDNNIDLPAIKKLKKASLDLQLCDGKAIYSAHSLYIRAGIYFLYKNYKKSLEIIKRAEILSEKHDIVWIIASCMRLKAHIMSRLNFNIQKHSLIKSSLEIAQSHHMYFLTRRLISEFDYAEMTSVASSKMKSTYTFSSSTTTSLSPPHNMRMQRYFDSLLHLGLASLHSNNLIESIYSFLDQVLHTVGGDRCFILLYKDNTELLYGRDSHSQTLSSQSTISRSIIEKVISTQLSVVSQADIYDENLLSQSVIMQDLKSILAVPMMLKEKFLGVMYLDSKIVKGVFSKEDANVLEAMASYISIAIESNRIASLEREKIEAVKDLEVAGAVQKLLLPLNRNIQQPFYKIKSYFQAATQSGGDWLWYQPLSDGSVLCFVGDVTGHGPGPAMMTATLAGAYHVVKNLYSDEEIKKDISHLMTTFQKCIQAIGQGEYWMSMTAVLYDHQESAVKYWSAGAPPPILFRENGEHSCVNMPSTPLGSQDFCLGFHKETKINSGDKVLLYTDGVFELKKSPDHYMSLGKFKKKALLWPSAMSIDHLYDNVMESIEDYSNDVQNDDIAFLILEIKDL